jgi:hypothetical protein
MLLQDECFALSDSVRLTQKAQETKVPNFQYLSCQNYI